ncbi:MAG: hypothetical protein FWG45_04440, partial [Oscillospiraceae bacterium]|nr:hypothetical protein [Oscillospiraceae bacterium]
INNGMIAQFLELQDNCGYYKDELYRTGAVIACSTHANCYIPVYVCGNIKHYDLTTGVQTCDSYQSDCNASSPVTPHTSIGTNGKISINVVKNAPKTWTQ